jgi:hypothetical protein
MDAPSAMSRRKSCIVRADLITTVKAGRFKPQLPDGNYL